MNCAKRYLNLYPTNLKAGTSIYKSRLIRINQKFKTILMKKILFTAILLSIILSGFSAANGQTITTVAGTDMVPPYHCGPYTGPATNASLGTITGVAVDGTGNMYITQEGCYVATKVDASGTISLLAGNGLQGFSGDGGPALAAEFNTPWGIAVNNRGGDGISNVYITDLDNNRVRKMDGFGNIGTIAGNGTTGFGGDGIPATDQGFSGPTGVALDDSGNAYISASYGWRVFKINGSGIISTIAGTGTTGSLGDGGPATAAQVYSPWAIAVDGYGNLYIAEAFTARVRKVTTDGIIQTIAGNGTGSYYGDGGPATDAAIAEPRGVAVDNCGNVYISDGINHVVRKVDTAGIISTVAGTGTGGFSGDNGPATAAELDAPEGIAVDAIGNLYIADSKNYRVRKVTFDIHCGISLGTKPVSAISVSVYPNPAHDILNIDNVTTPTTCTIFNVLGSLMQQTTLIAGNNSISVQSLSPGVYMLQLVDEEGNKVMRKVVRE